MDVLIEIILIVSFVGLMVITGALLAHCIKDIEYCQTYVEKTVGFDLRDGRNYS